MTEPQTVKVYDEETKEVRVIDVSDKHLEKVARGYILGTQKFSNQKQLQEKLESRVIKKIGQKGKFLTDKLFELIEGIYIIDKRGGKDGTSIKYYQQPPSLQAIIYALDRVLGKPKVVTEHSETKKGMVLVEHIIKGLVTNPKRGNERNGVGGNIPRIAGTGEGTGAAGVPADSDNVRVSEAVVS